MICYVSVITKNSNKISYLIIYIFVLSTKVVASFQDFDCLHFYLLWFWVFDFNRIIIKFGPLSVTSQSASKMFLTS